MSSKIGSIETMITVVQLGSFWCGVQVNPDESKFPITELVGEKKSAETAAKCFATQHHFLYRNDILEFNQPIVTIWKVQCNWVPAKIFHDRIEGAGQTTPSKEEAKLQAERVASREGLDFFPLIGEGCFPES